MKILDPLYYAVSWVVVQMHAGLSGIGLNRDSGLAWGLSIAGLVVLIRLCLFPLFVKQIHATRNMQVLQPRIKEIQQRHKDNREQQSQELMKLYKETGTNPLSSCLPIVAQAPFFYALYRVLSSIARDHAIGALTPDLVRSAANAQIFGAPIAAKFRSTPAEILSLGANLTTVRVVAIIMIVAMSASQFLTQRQLMVKNLPASSANNPFMQQQKILLYVFPLMFAVFGINFPIGVLLYWLTTNVWSMGQQLFVIRRMPTPGSLAHDRLQERQQRRAGSQPVGATSATASSEAAAPPATTSPRVQPKRDSRAKRKTAGPSPKRARPGESPSGPG